jgi:hypothetical protein
MNDFCCECFGSRTKKKEIKDCTDKCCPFYLYRYANLPYQERKRNEKN